MAPESSVFESLSALFSADSEPLFMLMSESEAMDSMTRLVFS